MAKTVDDGIDKFTRKLNPIAKTKNVLIEINGRKFINFCSNDYLSVSNHPKIIDACARSAKKYGVGSGGSRLLSGDREIFHELEKKVADFKKKESALVFNSGYQANIGIINALSKSFYKTIFIDQLAHASLIDGVLLSKIVFHRFRHNDIEHLAELLKKFQKGKSLVITESVFSMDGDFAPLNDIVSLKEKYDFDIYVDEAHATGIFGEKGEGKVEENNLSPKIEYIMGTFSKALGSFGAYFACSEEIKKFLINKCRSFIYSTSLPLPIVEANIKSIDIVQKETFRRDKLLYLAGKFRNLLAESGFKTPSMSQIVPIIIGDEKETIKISQILREKGFWVLPIRYPTVPKKQSRLRFSLNYSHEEDQLDLLIKVLSEAKNGEKYF